MSWAVEILDRDTGRFMFVPEDLTPVFLSWTDQVGADQATINSKSKVMRLRDWGAFLGQDVRVYDDAGRLAWWGYLESVREGHSGQIYQLSLTEMANRVAVSYLNPGDGFEKEYRQSSWKNDPFSQEVFGVKERILERYYLSAGTAERIASSWLTEHAQPAVRLIERETGGADGFDLSCRGWIQTLDWRIWQSWNGVLEHRPNQLGVQALGLDTNGIRVAQSFSLPDTVEAFSLGVRVRKQGMPMDALKLSLQTDLAGKPSGVALTSGSLAAAEINPDSYQWIELELAPAVVLTAGTRYWLVVERTAGSDPNHGFWLGLDENLGFSGGEMLLFNGSYWLKRQPDADLLFRFTGRKDFKQQITELIQFGGQFLNGVDTSQIQSSSLPIFLVQGRTCLQTLFDLLEQGHDGASPISARISPGRMLEIRPQAQARDAVFYMEENGSISNRFGQPLSSAWQVVGEWLHSPNGQPIYVRKVSFDARQNAFHVNQSWQVSKSAAISAASRI